MAVYAQTISTVPETLRERRRGAPSVRSRARSGARRKQREWVSRVAAAALVLLLGGLAHVWVRLKITEIGYGLVTTRDLVTRLEQEQRELETELAMLTAPQHLVDEARRRLRMQEPRAGQVVVLR